VYRLSILVADGDRADRDHRQRVMMSTASSPPRGDGPLSKVPTDVPAERARPHWYGTMVLESAGHIQGLNRIEYMPRPTRSTRHAPR